jgi:hypothetical protein
MVRNVATRAGLGSGRAVKAWEASGFNRLSSHGALLVVWRGGRRHARRGRGVPPGLPGMFPYQGIPGKSTQVWASAGRAGGCRPGIARPAGTRRAAANGPRRGAGRSVHECGVFLMLGRNRPQSRLVWRRMVSWRYRPVWPAVTVPGTGRSRSEHMAEFRWVPGRPLAPRICSAMAHGPPGCAAARCGATRSQPGTPRPGPERDRARRPGGRASGGPPPASRNAVGDRPQRPVISQATIAFRMGAPAGCQVQLISGHCTDLRILWGNDMVGLP